MQYVKSKWWFQVTLIDIMKRGMNTLLRETTIKTHFVSLLKTGILLKGKIFFFRFKCKFLPFSVDSLGANSFLTEDLFSDRMYHTVRANGKSQKLSPLLKWLKIGQVYLVHRILLYFSP